MTEEFALTLLRKRRQEGLEYFIDQYTPYVSAVVRNILGTQLPWQDGEEVVSDVFVALWRNADKPEPGKVKGYLGKTARNKAINRLRGHGMELTVEEDILAVPTPGPEETLTQTERARLLCDAVQSMDWPDREIFVRYYYYGEPAVSIAKALKMSPAGLRQRLKRGRDRLRETLMKGDMFDGV